MNCVVAIGLHAALRSHSAYGFSKLILLYICSVKYILFLIMYLHDNKTEDLGRKDRIIRGTDLSSQGKTNISLAHIKTSP